MSFANAGTRLVRYAWALPGSAMGLTIGLVELLFGAHIRGVVIG